MVWMSWAPSQAIAAGIQDAKLMEVADEVLAPVAGTNDGDLPFIIHSFNEFLSNSVLMIFSAA